jgi:hypothetical protein
MASGDESSAPAEQPPESSTSQGERLAMGAHVHASDGVCGDLTGAIVDPTAQAVTHLVVTPHHHHKLGRLVPFNLVAADIDPIRLSITKAEFEGLDEAQEMHLTRISAEDMQFGAGATHSSPYYGLGMLTGGMGAGGMQELHPRHEYLETSATDAVPTGRVEVLRGDHVHATDGWIGSVDGLVIDRRNRHVTHVLLAEGHLWGRKQVAIPISATARIDDEIRVELTKEQVAGLPAVTLADGS